MPQVSTAPVVAQTATGQQPTAVTFPGGAIPLTGIPRTEQEIQGLRNRIEMLQEQVSEAAGQRDELAREVRNGLPEGQARTGVEQRIAQIDQHILQLERDQQLAERQLSAAPPELLANTEHLDEIDPDVLHNMVDEDTATFAAFATFAAGVIVASIVGRIRRRKWKKQAAAAAMTSAATADPRIDRLSQAVDAIAEEVERIGEGQRFVTNLLAERREAVPIGGRTEERR